MTGNSEPPSAERTVGKYSCARDELLDVIQGMGWANDSSGSVESPTGFFARITNGTDDICELVEALPDEYVGLGRAHFKELVGHWLLSEDDRGFVTVLDFPTEEALIEAYEELDAAYCAWTDGCEVL